MNIIYGSILLVVVHMGLGWFVGRDFGLWLSLGYDDWDDLWVVVAIVKVILVVVTLAVVV